MGARASGYARRSLGRRPGLTARGPLPDPGKGPGNRRGSILCDRVGQRVGGLLDFQRPFLRAVAETDVDTAALSLPRGNGKSALCGAILADALDPDGELWISGSESVLCAGSVEQARITYRFCRDNLRAGDHADEYRFTDSAQRVSITHQPTDTRLRVISSSGSGAMGLGADTNLAIGEEPGAWKTVGGRLLFDALSTALGKPGSRMKLLLIGTLAPNGLPGSWWFDLVKRGTTGGTHVTALRGDPAKWNDWREIERVNPLAAISLRFTQKLIRELEGAESDTGLKARWLSYRFNVPSRDTVNMLLTLDDWKLVTERKVPPRRGRPIVGVDLGASRAWSAAVALWPSGRCEALALAPGLPSIAEQEKRDRVPPGLYQKLVDAGTLRVAEGLRVQPPGQLLAAIRAEWGTPRVLISDRFRVNELLDVSGGVQVIPRRTRWSEATADIRALRKSSRDGPLAVASGSRPIIEASLSASFVKVDDQGSARLEKSTQNTARDDVAAALLLAAGLQARSGYRAPRPIRVAVA